MSKCLITTPFMVWNTLSIQKTSASQTTPFKAWWHIVFLIKKISTKIYTEPKIIDDIVDFTSSTVFTIFANSTYDCCLLLF